MEYTVSYAAWQMECCGQTFAVGSHVKWPVLKKEPRGLPDSLRPVDYQYEAHCGDLERLLILEGDVFSLHLLYLSPRYTSEGVAGHRDWKLLESGMAAGYEPEYKGMECDAYITELENCTVRPARESDFQQENEDFTMDDDTGES